MPRTSAGRLACSALAAALLLDAGCGDDAAPPAPDGGALSTLQVLDPPGESIGLAFHGEATLRVLYLDPAGRPIPEAAVSFALVTSASETTGGSTITASSVLTDGAGVAQVQIVAGAEQVNFRVQASAAAAQPALFYVAVSEGGFTDLTVSPEHLGFRDPAGLGRVEVRLYRMEEVRCQALDLDDPPASVFPPRALDGFGGAVSYRNVTAGESFTLVAWASAEVGGVPVAGGCVELAEGQVRPGRPLRFPLAVEDRPPALPPRLEVQSAFDASGLAAAIGELIADPWPVLACPRGRAQLLIDCALDAQATDGALDCQVGGSSAVVTAVQARRGAPDAAGCRPATRPGGGDSMDAVVEARLGGPWPAGAALTALLEARQAPLTGFTLSSRLESTAGGAPLHHRLGALSIQSGAGAFSIDLVDSARPVVRQVAPAVVDPVAGLLALGPHAFTLRYGEAARDAFVALGLTPAGLAARQGDLGTALYQSVQSGVDAGCAAFSPVVCEEAGLSPTCLGAACAAAAGGLDDLLEGWWRAMDRAELDLVLTGEAALVEPDADLVLDALEQGSWSARIGLSGGQSGEVAGSWSAAPPSE